MSSHSPILQLDSRPSTRTTTRRVDSSPKPGKSRTRQFLASVSRSRSRPGTPDLTSGVQDELPRRSQSHDAMVTLSKMPSMASMSSDYPTRPSTRESFYPHQDGRQEKQPNLAKTLLHKSSRLLRQRKSSTRLRSPDTEEMETGFGSIEPTLSLSSRRSKNTIARPDMLKHSISEPYNFQHLTHTGPHEAKSLQTAGERDLATEFSALRAAQAPHSELKGIKADTIEKVPDDSSPLELVLSHRPADPESPTTSKEASRTTSRPTSQGPSLQAASDASESSLKSSQSADNFSRLASNSFSSQIPRLSPPPRRSSRRPMPLQNLAAFIPPPSQESPILPSYGASVCDARSLKQSPIPRSPLASPTDEAATLSSSPGEEIAQAVTTPDDSAYIMPSHGKTPSTTHIPLGDVPEEGVEATSTRSENVIRHAKSMPSTRHFSRIFPSLVIPDVAIPDPLNFTGEGIPSNGLARRVSRRVSRANGKVEILESWEDGVDFCYEHAMDEFDALDETCAWLEQEQAASGSDTTPPAHPPHSASLPPSSADDDPFTTMPELKSSTATSAASSSITVPGIVTPSEPGAPSPQILTDPRDINGGAAFTLSPTLLIPKEYSSEGRVTHEDTSYHYALTSVSGDNKFAAAPGSATSQNFSYYAGLGLETAGYSYQNGNSPRSSGGTGLSQQTSQDSLSVGAGLGVSRNSSNKHRPSSSIGSVPELVGGKAPEVIKQANAMSARSPRHSPSASSATARLRASPEHLDVDALRRNFIRAADRLPAEELEAATPSPGTPVKTTFDFGERLGKAREAAARDSANRPPRSRSNSDSAGRLLSNAGAPPTPTLHPGKSEVNPLENIGKPRNQHRLRSSSVANPGLTHKSKSSMGYSLFPSPQMRS